jgi:hypothetical protein
MELIYDSSRYCDELNHRWSWLRAVEWNGLPGVMAEPFIPILLLFWPIKTLLLTALVANSCWLLVGRKAISIHIASIVFWIRLLKWPVGFTMGLLFLTRHDVYCATICFLWLPFGSLCGIPGILIDAGTTKKRFLGALGYRPDQITLILLLNPKPWL